MITDLNSDCLLHFNSHFHSIPFPIFTPFSFKQTINQSTPHSIECCRAHAACIATPSGNNVNTESPSTRLQTGQNVTAVFSNDELRKLTNKRRIAQTHKLLAHIKSPHRRQLPQHQRAPPALLQLRHHHLNALD